MKNSKRIATLTFNSRALEYGSNYRRVNRKYDLIVISLTVLMLILVLFE